MIGSLGLCCEVYFSQCKMTSCSAEGLVQWLEKSAELFMPAPSQTCGRRCTIGSGKRLLNCDSQTPLCPRSSGKYSLVFPTLALAVD